MFKLSPIWPGRIHRVLEASTLEGRPAYDWLADDHIAVVRKVCLLNILAVLSSTPSVEAALIGSVVGVFSVAADRIAVSISSDVRRALDALVTDPRRPFYRDLGRPLAVHRALLDAPEALGLREAPLVSYRSEGSPSLQIVIADSPFHHTVADIDLDEYCPDQDVVSFVRHNVREVLPGKIASRTTDHMVLHDVLLRGPAAPYLCYTLTEA